MTSAAADSTASSDKKTEMTEEKPVKMVKTFLAMAGGNGDKSYAKSSSYQRVIIDSASGVLSSCLEKLSLPAADNGAFTIADVGCSSGPNTISLVSQVVKSVKELYHRTGQDEPEFAAYFNDLPSTDFNFLFHSLDSESRDFYYAGLPGSFHGRIRPRSSVNVFVTATTLHWMSQLPPAVTDKKSSAYNKDRIWLHGTNADVIDAYKQQSSDDMRSFFDARAEELVPGGLLFCILVIAREGSAESRELWLRPPSEDTPFTPISLMRLLEVACDELVSEGIFTEEQRAVCFIPMYWSTKEEVEEIVQSYDDIFQVEFLDHLAVAPRALGNVKPDEGSESDMEFVFRQLASVFEPLFSTVIGKDLACILLRRTAQLYSEKKKNGCSIGFALQLVLALTRK